MKYKIFVNSLLKLNVRLFYKLPLKYENIFIVDNNEDEISKFINGITYSDIKLHKIDTINIDDLEEICFWDRYMILDFPDEETALYFTMKYPAIIEGSDNV